MGWIIVIIAFILWVIYLNIKSRSEEKRRKERVEIDERIERLTRKPVDRSSNRSDQLLDNLRNSSSQLQTSNVSIRYNGFENNQNRTLHGLDSDFSKLNLAVKGLYYRTKYEQNRACKLRIGEEVFLEREKSNINDRYATKVKTSDNIMIGYVDSAYSHLVSEWIADNYSIHCYISKITSDAIPYIYMDVFYKVDITEKQNVIIDIVNKEVYITYDLEQLRTLDNNIQRYKVSLDSILISKIRKRITVLQDEKVYEEIKDYTPGKLQRFLDSPISSNIGSDLHKWILDKIAEEPLMEKLQRERNNISSGLRKHKKSGNQAKIQEFETLLAANTLAIQKAKQKTRDNDSLKQKIAELQFVFDNAMDVGDMEKATLVKTDILEYQKQLEKLS